MDNHENLEGPASAESNPCPLWDKERVWCVIQSTRKKRKKIALVTRRFSAVMIMLCILTFSGKVHRKIVPVVAQAGQMENPTPLQKIEVTRIDSDTVKDLTEAPAPLTAPRTRPPSGPKAVFASNAHPSVKDQALQAVPSPTVEFIDLPRLREEPLENLQLASLRSNPLDLREQQPKQQEGTKIIMKVPALSSEMQERRSYLARLFQQIAKFNTEGEIDWQVLNIQPLEALGFAIFSYKGDSTDVRQALELD